MDYYYYLSILIFSIIGFMIVIDPNTGLYFTLMFKLLNINFQRLIWMIRFHPNNFITTWISNRKYDKIAKELEREFSEK